MRVRLVGTDVQSLAIASAIARGRYSRRAYGWLLLPMSAITSVRVKIDACGITCTQVDNIVLRIKTIYQIDAEGVQTTTHERAILQPGATTGRMVPTLPVVKYTHTIPAPNSMIGSSTYCGDTRLAYTGSDVYVRGVQAFAEPAGGQVPDFDPSLTTVEKFKGLLGCSPLVEEATSSDAAPVERSYYAYYILHAEAAKTYGNGAQGAYVVPYIVCDKFTSDDAKGEVWARTVTTNAPLPVLRSAIQPETLLPLATRVDRTRWQPLAFSGGEGTGVCLITMQVTATIPPMGVFHPSKTWVEPRAYVVSVQGTSVSVDEEPTGIITGEESGFATRGLTASESLYSVGTCRMFTITQADITRRP